MRWLLLAALLLAACDSGPTAPEALGKLQGEWEGQVAEYGYTVTVRLEVYGNYVQGEGSIEGEDFIDGLVVKGTSGRRHVSITMIPVLYDSYSWVGAWYDKDTLVGALWGSGFYGDPLTMVRRR